jgi:hypothetical protein
MFNLKQFITDHVIYRPTSMFVTDIEANKEVLQAEIRNLLTIIKYKQLKE